MSAFRQSKVKDLLIYLGVALLLSCSISSFYVCMGWLDDPESPFGIGVADVKSSIMGVEKRDFKIPPANAVDDPGMDGYATDVFAQPVPGNARYPVNGVW